MSYDLIDTRQSLWDMALLEFEINEKRYHIQREPDRGATCIVYDVIKEELIDGDKSERRLLLKEFYPIFDMDESPEIKRAPDGKLIIPEYIKKSKSYQARLDRFKESYRMFNELGKYASLVEHMSIALSLFTDGNTWYIEEAWDSGLSFTTYIDWDLALENFLYYFGECVRTVGDLHNMGFYHLDLKPSNISCTTQGNIRLFDTDSFVRKEDLGEKEVWSTAGYYSAPEIRSARAYPEDAPYLIGPWTDIYSLGQIFCRYLFGHPLDQESIEESLKNVGELVEEKAKIPDPSQKLGFHVSGRCIYYIKEFIRKCLNRHLKSRYQSIDDVLCVLDRIQWELGCDTIKDTFRESRGKFPGYEKTFEYIEKGLNKDHMVCLAGEDVEKGERIARGYVTAHRTEYRSVSEIHLDNFNHIYKEIDAHFESAEDLEWVLSKNPGKNLILIFDNRMENELEIGELSTLFELMELRWNYVEIVIVGRYDRCKEFNKRDFNYPKLDMDKAETEEEKGEVSFKEKVIKGMLWFALWALGGWFVRSLAQHWTVSAYYEKYDESYFGFDIPVQWGMLLEAAAAVMLTVAIAGVFYIMYTHYKAWNLREFLKRYRSSICSVLLGFLVFCTPAVFPRVSYGYLYYVYDWHSVTASLVYQWFSNIILFIIGMIFYMWCRLILLEGKSGARLHRVISRIVSIFFLLIIYAVSLSNLWHFFWCVAVWFLMYIGIGAYAGCKMQKIRIRRVTAWLAVSALLGCAVALPYKSQFRTEKSVLTDAEDAFESCYQSLLTSLESVRESVDSLAFFVENKRDLSDENLEEISDHTLIRLGIAYSVATAYVCFNPAEAPGVENIEWEAPYKSEHLADVELDELKEHYVRIPAQTPTEEMLMTVQEGWYGDTASDSSTEWKSFYKCETDTYVMSYVRPVYVENRLFCVVGMDVDMCELMKERDGYLSEEYTMYLEDAGGNIVYESGENAVKQWNFVTLSNDLTLYISVPDEKIYISNLMLAIQAALSAAMMAYVLIKHE